MGIRQIGSVESLIGEITLRHQDGTSEQLRADSILHAGDILSAADHAHASLRLVDGSFFEIGSGQVVTLDEARGVRSMITRWWLSRPTTVSRHGAQSR